MAACEKCGAQIAPYVPKCQYCNTTTAFGAAQQAEQLRHQAAAEFQASQFQQVRARQAEFAAGLEVQRSAEQAFNWALAGLFLCCIPVLPIVGIVLGFRARSQALSRGLPVPSKAVLAIALGFTSLVFLGGAVALNRHLDAEKASHRERLEKAIGKHAGDAAPSVDVLCKLSELYLLDNEFKGKRLSDGDVNCDGAKWNLSDERSELTGARIRIHDSAQAQEANVCFKHGQKWIVDAVVTTSCSDSLRDKAAAMTSATASAAVHSPKPVDPLGPAASTPTLSASSAPKTAPRAPGHR